MNILQTLLNGVLVGGVYACIGAGFSLIWGVMGVVNLAHGSLIVLGSYLTYWFSHLMSTDPFVTLPITMFIAFVIGYTLQRIVINKVIQAEVSRSMLAAFGFDLILVNIMLFTWSADFRSVITSYSSESLQLGRVIFPYARGAVFAAAVVLTISLQILLTRTRLGWAIRATAMDRKGAQIIGVDVTHIYAITTGLGAAWAGAAGCLLSLVYSFSPVVGGTWLTKSFAVVCLGGLGNIFGSFIGGLILGIAEIFGSNLLGSGWQEAIGIIIMILILLIRPQGIFGQGRSSQRL